MIAQYIISCKYKSSCGTQQFLLLDGRGEAGKLPEETSTERLARRASDTILPFRKSTKRIFAVRRHVLRSSRLCDREPQWRIHEIKRGASTIRGINKISAGDYVVDCWQFKFESQCQCENVGNIMFWNCFHFNSNFAGEYKKSKWYFLQLVLEQFYIYVLLIWNSNSSNALIKSSLKLLDQQKLSYGLLCFWKFWFLYCALITFDFMR